MVFANRGAIFTSALVMMMMIHHDDALTWTQMAAEVAPTVRSEFKQVAPEGLEDEDEPDKIQRTQTVDLRSPGIWSPTEEATAHANTRLRFGALGQGVPGVGVKIVQVYSGSTAQKMGLEVGDIIRSINGVGVDDIVNYVRLVKNSGPRITLEVRDVRTGNYVQAQGDLDDGQGDDGPPPAPSRPRFGAVAVNHNGTSGGLFVTHLVPGTPAARLQLDYGDIILEINGRPISDQVSYASAVRESGRTMDLLIINVRNGQRQTAQVMLDY
jgi:S1-C subfamily serine protease